MDISELLGQQQDSGVGIDDFELVVGGFQIFVEADGAVISEEDRVGIFHEGGERFAEAGVAGRDIFGRWDAAEKYFGLGMDAGWQFKSGNRERRRMRRMAVNDRANIGAVFIDEQVHQDFACARALAGNLLAFDIDDAEVVGLELTFADAGGRAENPIFGKTIGMISFVAGAEALQPDSAADVAHQFLELPFADSV